jgi:hypothetical protein
MIGGLGAAIGSAVGSVGGSVLSFIGQERTNRQNRMLAREANQFEREEAEKNRAFQERMSGSAYQRAVRDLRKADLNPALAYAQGGASTPSGGSGSGHTATMQNSLEGAVATAMEATRLKEEIKNIKADTNKKNQEAKAVSKTHPEAEAKNLFWNKLKEAVGSKAKSHNYTPEWKRELQNPWKKGQK